MIAGFVDHVLVLFGDRNALLQNPFDLLNAFELVGRVVRIADRIAGRFGGFGWLGGFRASFDLGFFGAFGHFFGTLKNGFD